MYIYNYIWIYIKKRPYTVQKKQAKKLKKNKKNKKNKKKMV